MVKGLAYRQGLSAAQAVLAMGLVVLAVVIVRELLSGPPVVAGPGPYSSVGPDEILGQLPQVGDLAAYNGIVASGLFGDAGRYKTTSDAVVAPPSPPQEEEAETQLALTLKGTVFTTPKDPRASAVIEVRERRTATQTFYLSQEVLERVFLVEVRKNAVILDNRRTGRLEKLTREPGFTLPEAPVTRVSTRRPVTPRGNSNTVLLNRNEIVTKLNDEWDRLSATINIKVVKDEQGNVQGLTTENIGQFEIANELGFEDGDVLVSINNEKVDSADKVKDILNKYRNAKVFRVGVSRGGQLKYIVYRLR